MLSLSVDIFLWTALGNHEVYIRLAVDTPFRKTQVPRQASLDTWSCCATGLASADAYGIDLSHVSDKLALSRAFLLLKGVGSSPLCIPWVAVIYATKLRRAYEVPKRSKRLFTSTCMLLHQTTNVIKNCSRRAAANLFNLTMVLSNLSWPSRIMNTTRIGVFTAF